MITAYHRPKTLDEALTLLAQPNRTPLGGGTLLSKPGADSVEAVDLQALNLNTIEKLGNGLKIGATVTLQELLISELCPDALRTALQREAPLNIRNAATVAGTLVSCDGRSTFVTVLLALDAKLEQTTLDDSKIESRTSNIGNFLPLRNLQGALITSLTIPLNAKFAFEYVSRTPADKPIVCAALAQWNSGRTRLALGGYGKSPMLAMDGTEAEGMETAARNTFHEASDEWASAEYRTEIAATLVKRCLEAIS
ncbi:MAG TPA: FAD binding domain-containing protein [Anaerolineales bacterium]|jgi:CO/xanthine dehydrogenase FAD-binding subunit|nr:FAD binding domain-containing protein [Anaerolineales bacterium]